jgi:hypothetical protein
MIPSPTARSKRHLKRPKRVFPIEQEELNDKNVNCRLKLEKLIELRLRRNGGKRFFWD